MIQLVLIPPEVIFFVRKAVIYIFLKPIVSSNYPDSYILTNPFSILSLPTLILIHCEFLLIASY